MSVEHLSAAQLNTLSLQLSSIEDWLRDHCPARHADDMADVVHEAWEIVDDLYDEAEDREGNQTRATRVADRDTQDGPGESG